MCKCTPEMRTPYCGKPGCEWPQQYTTPEPDERTYYPEDEVAHMVAKERERTAGFESALREIELRTSPYRGNDQEWPLVSGVNAVARKALGLTH